MRKMNCRNVRREIEEVAAGDLLSSPAIDHLKNCAECEIFRGERLKLREMLSSLGAVEAPGDFDFRLRARLANEKRGSGQPFVMRNLSFGFRSAAVATILLLIGSSFLIVNLRTQPGNPLSASSTKATSPAIKQTTGNVPPGTATSPGTGDQVAPPHSDSTASVNPNSTGKPQKASTSRLGGSRRTEVAVLKNASGLKTRELSSTGATVLRPRDAMNQTGSTVFPIGAPFQSLKVSLDNGRGSSRTISLPSVSFGSQRVLAQGSSPLLASARSDW